MLNENKAPPPLPSPSKPPPTDLIEDITGAFGKYQLLLCFLMFLSKFGVVFHQMAIIFLAPKIEYTCPGSDEKCPCTNPEYDRSIFTRSIIMEWDLICDKKWLANFNQTVFQMGTLIGSLLFGMASDRFGRRYPVLVVVVLQAATGIAAAFAPDYWSFTFLRFLIGTAVGGSMVITFVIVMEFIGTQHRDTVSALYQVPYNLGHMLLPVFGYFFRDYSDFQLAISTTTLILLSYICLAPETPRWLIAMKRTEEAIILLKRVAEMNNRPTENIQSTVEAYQAEAEKNKLKKGNITDLFRTPNLRKNILCISCNWLTCSYCFYGVSQYVGHLSGDVFLNVGVGAFFTLCGSLISIVLLKHLGRKTILISCNFICGSCLLLLAVIPDSMASVACAIVGEVFSFIVFVMVYLYTSELFPTVVRNAAIGFSSMWARVGAMIAPFVVGVRDTALWLPPLLFAIPPLISGVVCFLLPETRGCALMTTIEEGEQFGKKKKSSSVVIN